MREKSHRSYPPQVPLLWDGSKVRYWHMARGVHSHFSKVNSHVRPASPSFSDRALFLRRQSIQLLFGVSIIQSIKYVLHRQELIIRLSCATRIAFDIITRTIRSQDIMSSNSSVLTINPPPAGQISNFVNPPSLAVRMTIANAICVSVSVITVTLRMYTRYWLVNALKLDDCKF